MRKNAFKKVMALLICAMIAVPTVACGGGSDASTSSPTNSNSSSSSENNSSSSSENNSSSSSENNSESESSSSSSTGGNESEDSGSNLPKTKIRVYFYNAGYGEAWINELAHNFEKEAANISFEEGKMGVTVDFKGDMADRTAEVWRSEPYDVLFLENPYEFYGMMKTGVVEPLDSIMNVQNEKDGNQTIAGKMTQQQMDAYSYNGHSYGIPHYLGSYGLIYNIDLFNDYNFYFAKEAAGDNVFISDSNPTKSAGPDGQEGTEDDGLPTTYEKFYALCDQMVGLGVIPLGWTGKHQHHYIQNFLDSLIANQEGAEQMTLNYTFNGTANDLIKVDKNGNPIIAKDGSFEVESLEITSSNAYQLARQKGRYYAMDFLGTLLGQISYYSDKCVDETVSHYDIKDYFLENGVVNNEQQYAMLVDGVWWEGEASATFEKMEKNNPKYSKMNRNFGWMPLPQATQADADAVANGTKKPVFADSMNTVVCIKSNATDPVKAASKAFLQYAYSDEALKNFTYTTGTTIGVDYLDVFDDELDSADSKLTPFERSLIKYLKKADLVCEVSSEVKFASNIKSFKPVNAWKSGSYESMIEAIVEEGDTALNYFKGHQKTYKGLAW